MPLRTYEKIPVAIVLSICLSTLFATYLSFYFYHLTAALEAWLRGEAFERIAAMTEEDPGSLIRYFRMALQILREVLGAPVSDELKQKIRSLVRQINRGIIDAEKQLRA